LQQGVWNNLEVERRISVEEE